MIDKLAKADDKRLSFLRNMGERWRAMPRLWRATFWVALVALLFALPRLQIPIIDPLIRTTTIDFTTVLFTVAMYVIVAVGMNIVIGLAGLLDLGYIGFFAIGAYSVALFGSPESSLGTAWPWLLCVPIAIALTMFSGVLLGWPTLRVRGDYLAIVTLGFGEIVRLIAQNSQFTNGQRGISDIPHPPGTWPAGFNVNWTGLPMFGSATALGWYWLTLLCVIFCIAGSLRLERSRVGRSWLAIREDEDAAAIMGVQGFKFKLWAFAIGAALGGLAGALFAGKQQFMGSNSFDLLTSILFVAMVVIGGSGNTVGVILGAILVWYLPERLRGIDLFGVEIDVGQYRLLAFGIALIVIMTFRPQGLLPKKYRSSQPPIVEEEVEEAHERVEEELAETQEQITAGKQEPAVGAGIRPTLLKVDDVILRFGGVTALDQVDFEVREGEILGLIGPNGAGKTTCFNVMTGVFKPTSGRVTFAGKPITGRKEYQITRMGIARTFQNIRLFPQMTALENVLVGTDARHKTSVVGALFRLPRVRAKEHTLPEKGYKRTLAKVFGISRHVAEERAARAKALELLDFVGVTAHPDEQAKDLSYGEQRRLEIARALATEPKLLCLDEPAAGFNPTEKVKLLGLIRKIRDQGLTVLLIEHDMRLVMGVTDRIVVLEFGKKIAEGSPAEVRANPKVIAAYLGVPEDAA